MCLIIQTILTFHETVSLQTLYLRTSSLLHFFLGDSFQLIENWYWHWSFSICGNKWILLSRHIIHFNGVMVKISLICDTAFPEYLEASLQNIFTLPFIRVNQHLYSFLISILNQSQWAPWSRFSMLWRKKYVSEVRWCVFFKQWYKIINYNLTHSIIQLFLYLGVRL